MPVGCSLRNSGNAVEQVGLAPVQARGHEGQAVVLDLGAHARRAMERRLVAFVAQGEREPHERVQVTRAGLAGDRDAHGERRLAHRW